MSKGFYISKALGIGAVILTLSAIAGIVTMIIVYRAEISGLNPTPRPTFAPTTPFPTGPPPKMRLPGDLVPESYTLFLQPHFYTHIEDVVNVTSPNQTLTFTGNSTVNFRCIQRTKTIFIHSKNLSVTEVKVMNRDANERIDVLEQYHHDVTDFFEIQLGDVLEQEGNYSLFTAFQGEMKEEEAVGLYISKYKDGVPAYGDDADRYVAASQFQATHARNVFPCFDEPALKATFLVTVIHRRGTLALGNSEMSDNRIIDDEWEVTSLHPTQKMSTYLLAFVVSEFKSVPSTTTNERVKINIYARPAAIEAGHADYAASIAGKMLNYFEGRFGIDFPQRKLDHVAVADMPGAMENWGLIIYGELALLFDQKKSSLLHKETIASYFGHELAHQWFGNLVTCNWWNEIWLNEGFASYMTFFAVDNVEPSWNLKDVWAVSHLDDVLDWDSTNASHALNTPMDSVQTPDQILDMFSIISYSKGALVLRMLADLLTQRVFDMGVNNYLNAFHYQSTTSANLWHYLQKAVDDDGGHTKVAEVMDSWTNQIGYPVITINTTTGEIYQKSSVEDSDVVWHVPIRVRSHTSEPSLVMLDTSDIVMKDEFISKDGEWILANINCAGYYKVNYNPENWDRLFAQLERNLTVIPLINRGQLVGDTFNLAKKKVVNVTLALNATRFLRNEREYLPWKTAVNNLGYFKKMFDRSEVYGPMQAYLRKQVKGLYHYVQRNNTDCLPILNCTVPPLNLPEQHLQITAIATACDSELPECVEMATQQFKDWMNTSINRIDPDLRSTIYCHAVAAGGEAEWEFLWNILQNITDVFEQEEYLSALGCTRKVWLLNRFLEYSLDTEKIRKLTIHEIIMSVAKNEAGLALAWNFVRARYSEMPENICLSCLVGEVSGRFSTEFELYEVKQFQKEANITDSKYMEVTIELVEANIAWVKENKQTVLEWFRKESAS